MRVTNELLSNYQHLIGELTLITGSKGVFDVAVDGTQLFSKAETSRFPEEGEILTALEQHLPEGSSRYGD